MAIQIRLPGGTGVSGISLTTPVSKSQWAGTKFPRLKAELVVSPFSAAQMEEFARYLRDTIFYRWDIELDVHDTRVPPLTERYAKFKQRKYHRPPLRDLLRTGKLRRAIQVLSATQNRAVIGPVQGIHTSSKFTGKDKAGHKRGDLSYVEILRFNQRRARMWGVSPNDNAKLLGRVRQELAMRFMHVKFNAA